MGSVQDYVKMLTTIMLDIRDKMEKDKPFFLLNSLLCDAAMKL